MITDRLDQIKPVLKCGAHLNLHGADFQCDQTPDHFGLAHTNKDAQAVWGPVPQPDALLELLSVVNPEPAPWPTA